MMYFRSTTIDAVGRTKEHPASNSGVTPSGAVTVGGVSFAQDWTLECEDVGSSYFVHMPLSGSFESWHRGVRLVASRTATPVYQPDGGSFQGEWEAGTRSLCVKLAPGAVRNAFAKLLGEQAPARITFDPVMNTAVGYGHSWANLLLLLNRQRSAPDSLLTQPLIAAPLEESALLGFLFASTHSHSKMLAAPVKGAQSTAVRAAVDLMEADPKAPLTVAALAAHSGVGVRGLQQGFREHLGISPMAYLRTVRLMRAHKELRSADPSVETVTAVAQRWGFHHPGRFAAAHEARYGQPPLIVLRSPA
jgi:AraC-like DNA-binding protein